MSDAILPSLKCTRAVRRSQIFNTAIETSISGKEWRSTWQIAPRYRYALSISAVRQYGSLVEAQALVDFFSNVVGAWDSFLFVDPYDGVTRRVRFDGDELQYDRIAQGYWATEIRLISVIDATAQTVPAKPAVFAIPATYLLTFPVSGTCDGTATTMHLFVDGVEVSTCTPTGDTWSGTVTVADSGTYAITAKASNAAGTSVESDAVTAYVTALSGTLDDAVLYE